jgi:hypothetical protein
MTRATFAAWVFNHPSVTSRTTEMTGFQAGFEVDDELVPDEPDESDDEEELDEPDEDEEDPPLDPLSEDPDDPPELPCGLLLEEA